MLDKTGGRVNILFIPQFALIVVFSHFLHPLGGEFIFSFPLEDVSDDVEVVSVQSDKVGPVLRPDRPGVLGLPLAAGELVEVCAGVDGGVHDLQYLLAGTFLT